MSKIFIAGILFAVLPCCMAQEWKEVKAIHKSANENWQEGILQDSASSHAGRIEEEIFPGLWSYWRITSGDNPENFKLTPLKFNAEKSKKWKRPYWENPKSNATPVIAGVYGYLPKTSPSQGMGIAFHNPYAHAISVAVEGNLRCYNYRMESPYRVYLFVRTSDEQTKLLKSSSDKEAVYSIESKKKDGTLDLRHYFRLGVDCVIPASGTIYLMLYDPSVKLEDNKEETRRIKFSMVKFCLDEGRGKVYRPIFIITDSSDKKEK
jgi:hypothetical protein